MATGHRVSRPNKKNRQPAPLPREVVPTAPRQYVDRWGVRYEVIWNGLPADGSLTGAYATEASS
jgi:hypothetical protein